MLQPPSERLFCPVVVRAGTANGDTHNPGRFFHGELRVDHQLQNLPLPFRQTGDGLTNRCRGGVIAVGPHFLIFIDELCFTHGGHSLFFQSVPALVAAGSIALDPESDKVRLLHHSFQPLAGSDDQVEYLAKNIGDHIAAAGENVLGRTPAHFERAVHYAELTGDQVRALRQIYEAEQMAVLERLNARAAEMKAGTTNRGGMRFRAGGYFYETKDKK